MVFAVEQLGLGTKPKLRSTWTLDIPCWTLDIPKPVDNEQ